MEKILDKKQIDGWIAALSDWEVFAPALQDGIWAYRPVSGAVQLAHPNTKQPPKGFSFPQREVFFSFEQIKGEPPKLTQKLPHIKHQAVFGVRPCDGRGAVRMDKVFSDHVEDPYYWERRKKVAYVGLACNKPAGSDCFCLSVGGSPVSTDGLDVMLTDMGDRYFVSAVTKTGKALMAAAGNLLSRCGRRRSQASETGACRCGGTTAARSEQRQWGCGQVEGELRFAAVGRTGTRLHRLRHLHLPVPDLPLLRHQRRADQLVAVEGQSRAHLGQLPVPRISPCTLPGTTRARHSVRGCASG